MSELSDNCVDLCDRSRVAPHCAHGYATPIRLADRADQVQGGNDFSYRLLRRLGNHHLLQDDFARMRMFSFML